LLPSTVAYTIIAHGSSVEGVAYFLRVRSSAILLLFCVSQKANGKKKERRRRKEKK